MFIILIIKALWSARHKPVGMLTSRLWLAFQVLITCILNQVFQIFGVSVMLPYAEAFNLFMSIFVSSLDYVSILTVTLLSSNLLCAMKRPDPSHSRMSTILWILASIAVWIIGFGVGMAFNIETYPPLYLSIIQTFVVYVISYVCSLL